MEGYNITFDLIFNFDESPFKMSSDTVHTVAPTGSKECILGMKDYSRN
jgi:hypothetical protein